MKTKLTIILLLLLMTGCAQLTPRQKYMVASDTYIGVAETLVTLREADKLDDKEHRRAVFYSRLAQANLNAWKNALKKGRDAPDAIELFYVNLGRLMILKREAEDGQ